MKRVIVMVLDSVGVGELDDAVDYGDAGSNTLANTAKKVGGLNLPNLAHLGLGNIIEIEGIAPNPHPMASFGKMAQQSAGKDSTTGHWEMMGLILKKPFPVFPDGFPASIIEEFSRLTGRGVLGNKAASGTEIIEELGRIHQDSGQWIVYTSADSVFQVAAHEETVGIDELYRACAVARQRVLTGDHAVGRVIARPFIGTPGAYQRTPRRRDFSLAPPSGTALDFIKETGHEVYAIGKIHELFNDHGISGHEHISDNLDGMSKLLARLKVQQKGLILINLVDFDMKWGHRNDAAAYANGLVEVDRFLAQLLGSLNADDILIITADHGCDPTTPSTDHSREYVPLLVYSPDALEGNNLGIRDTFADLGATVCDIFGIMADIAGTSFADELPGRKMP